MGEKGDMEMTEETSWKQYLTEEALKECWDADKRPGGDLPNRTFDNQSDMMYLYRYMYEDNRWKDFFDTLWIKFHRFYNAVDASMIDYIAWLFCLGNEDYESSCKLVAEFYGWKESFD